MSYVRIFALVVLAVGLGATVFSRQQELASLKTEQARLQTLIENTPRDEVPKPPAVQPEVSPELLRLRNQVSQLTKRRSELANVGEENNRLRLKVAATQTNAPSSLANDYVTMKGARMAGFDSPTNALQTFLWALRTHDVAALSQSFVPDELAQLTEDPNDLPKTLRGMNGNGIPGFSVIGTQPLDDGSVELTVQTIPDLPLVKITLKQVDGHWRLTETPWDLGLTIVNNGE